MRAAMQILENREVDFNFDGEMHVDAALDPEIRSFVSHHRKNGGTCYVGGPVSAYPEIVLGELNPSAVVLDRLEQTGAKNLRTDLLGALWIRTDGQHSQAYRFLGR